MLGEVDAAIALGVPVEGVCLYPILDHPGWDNDRYCPNGLLACSPAAGERLPDPALAEVIASFAGGAFRRAAATASGGRG